MRETRNAQRSVFDFYTKHPLGEPLKTLSDLIDNQALLLASLEPDVCRSDTEKTRTCGLGIESAFRCLLFKQILKVSYEKLSFHLCDSSNYRTFARLEPDQHPSRSGLHSAIRCIKADTLKQIFPGTPFRTRRK